MKQIYPLFTHDTEMSFYKLLLRGANGKTSLRFLDLILLNKGKPILWLFTDTQGKLSTRLIGFIGIDELIKSVIGNVDTKESEVEHKDVWV